MKETFEEMWTKPCTKVAHGHQMLYIETLRLDKIERSSSKYKNADIVIFTTGHCWKHEKTYLL
jgi:hypothetical protein